MKKKIKADKENLEAEDSEEQQAVNWREVILHEAEWRLQLLAMLERIAVAQEKRNEMLDEEDSDDEDEE